MSHGKSNTLLWIGVVLCAILIAMAWVGYKSVGYQLLFDQLPLCG